MSDDEENVEEIDPISDYEPPQKTTRGGATKRGAAVPVPVENAESPKGKYYNSKMRCPYGCNKVLAQRTIDYHRTNGCRTGQEEPYADSTRKKNYCCGVCFAEFVTRPAFLTHMSDEHDVSASVHHLTFPNKTLFMRFVRWLEAEGGAHFRHKSGAKRRASGKGIFMACNRSGYVGRSVDDPIRNKSGNFRTGYTCTGFIHGTEHNNGSISIEFCGDHYGHDARMRLPNVIKQLIAQKQMDGETFVDITNYLRRQFAPLSNDCIYAQRVCLVDLDELRTLLVTTTRKWESTGIPLECEIWEEEFLDRAGITREGAPRMRKEGDKSTEELAKELKWPRPHVFTAKMKVGSGVVEIPELKPITAETRRDVSQLQASNARTQNTNVFRENLKTVTADTAEPDVCVDDDRTSPDLQEEKEQKIDVTTVSSPVKPTPPEPLPERMEPNMFEDKTSVAEPIKQLVPKPLSSRHLTRAQAISGMIAEMHTLESMIRNDSGSASGTFLVAFMTRIKQLRISYAAGILPANQPMGERQPRLSNLEENKDTEPRAHTAEDQAHEEEEIAEIGTDYSGVADLERQILETVGEGHSYNSLFWT